MRMAGHCLLFFLFSIRSFAQDTSAVPASDTSKKNPFEIFQWKDIRKGEFEITVPGYDTLKMGTNNFQSFYYTTTDKPDGKLTVRDDKGNKVRECSYRNKLMFDEHWWYPTGEKEFDGTWSETANEYGDQFLTEYKWYYRNKKIRKHGFRTGITTTYYDNGVPESEKTFRDGKPNGPFTEYFPNGKIQTQGQYFDGNKTGEWIHYNPDGTVREREH
jgi:antitoxin component YwqK of YwqJK toxin-antitoxin module